MDKQGSLFDYEQKLRGDEVVFQPTPAKDPATDTRGAAFRDVRSREPGRQESPRYGSGIPTAVRDLGPTQRIVYDVLAEASRPLTDREIEARCDLRISTITARRNDLVEHGLVEKAEKRPCTVSSYTGKVQTWTLTSRTTVRQR